MNWNPINVIKTYRNICLRIIDWKYNEIQLNSSLLIGVEWNSCVFHSIRLEN